MTEQVRADRGRNQAMSNKIKVQTPDGVREVDIYGEDGLRIVSNLWTRAGWQHRIYDRVRWLGIPIMQLPEDILMMQELIYQVRPDVIVETGVAYGGTAVLYASMLELLGKGQVISIDIKLREDTRLALHAHPMSKRIILLEGSSTDKAVVARVQQMVRPEDKVLVALDSNHTYTHVRQELEQYSPLVKPEGYIVVFDGVMEILADAPSGKPEWVTDNPAAAVRDFLVEHPEFEVDPYYNRLSVTYSPGGFLRRRLP
jgi:cephalosporin hydroxylase